MLTWLFQLIRFVRRAMLDTQDIYVSQATLVEINRNQNLRKGGNR